VAERRTDRFHAAAGRDQHAGEGVAQVAVADALEAGALASLAPLVAERLPVDRLAVSVEHEAFVPLA
jgi:hypothetical protein